MHTYFYTQQEKALIQNWFSSSSPSSLHNQFDAPERVIGIHLNTVYICMFILQIPARFGESNTQAATIVKHAIESSSNISQL